MRKVSLIALVILGMVFGVQAQNSDNSITLSEVQAGNVTLKLSKNGKLEVFSIVVEDEDHSCVADFCGFSYNNKNKSYKHNITTLSNNLKEVYKTLGHVEKQCDVLKWETEGIKFTVYGIAPNVAYICVDGHGHGIMSKEDVKKVSDWIETLDIK